MTRISNYSTSVSPKKTIGEIQHMLGDHGVRRITIEYDHERKEPSGLTFTIATEYGERSFRLPARVEGVYHALEREYAAGQLEKRYTGRQHAAAVAWRIIKDWVRGQLAMIEAGLADLSEIMLPYLLVDASQTLYQLAQASEMHFTHIPQLTEGTPQQKGLDG